MKRILLLIAISAIILFALTGITQDQKKPQKQLVKIEKVDTTKSVKQQQLEQRIIQKQMELNEMKLDSLEKRAKAKKSENGGG